MAEHIDTGAGELMALGVGFGAQSPPPGYRVDRLDSGHCHWVRLAGEDWDLEGEVHWDHWAAFRGAWAHYRKARQA